MQNIILTMILIGSMVQNDPANFSKIQNELPIEAPISFLSNEATQEVPIKTPNPVLSNKVQKKISMEVPILVYHHIVKDQYDDRNNPFVIGESAFRSQMDELVREGYQTITLDDYRKSLEGQAKLPNKPIILTFDDGYASNYYLAHPLLKERKLKATIFVVTSRISEVPMAFDGKDTKPKVAWSQLGEMVASGVWNIQSHTHDAHYMKEGKGYLEAPLTKENGFKETTQEFQDRIRQEFSTSKYLIKERLGMDVFAIAYPNSSYSDYTLKALKETGYTIGVVMQDGMNTGEENPLLLKRINMDSRKGLTERIAEIKK